MSEGELYKKMKTLNQEGAYPSVDSCSYLDQAKSEFPVKYVYDAWEIPETKAQTEKQLCRVIAWYQKWFGSPVNSEVVKDV